MCTHLVVASWTRSMPLREPGSEDPQASAHATSAATAELLRFQHWRFIPGWPEIATGHDARSRRHRLRDRYRPGWASALARRARRGLREHGIRRVATTWCGDYK